MKMKNKTLQIHNLIGKALCALAGSVIGFLIGGYLLIAPGILAGFIVGSLLENVLSPKQKKVDTTR